MTNQEHTLGYFLWIILLFVTVSCNFGHAGKSTFCEKNDVTEAFSTGQWKILVFKKDGVEIKKNYESYLFHFSEDFKIKVIKDSNAFDGQWHVDSSDGEDDAPNSDINFVMAADPNSPLSELTASWQIIERTKSKLMLNKVSRSGKTIDSLIFEKQ